MYVSASRGSSRVEASNRACTEQERSGSEGGGPPKEDELELSLASRKAAG